MGAGRLALAMIPLSIFRRASFLFDGFFHIHSLFVQFGALLRIPVRAGLARSSLLTHFCRNRIPFEPRCPMQGAKRSLATRRVLGRRYPHSLIFPWTIFVSVSRSANMKDERKAAFMWPDAECSLLGDFGLVE